MIWAAKEEGVVHSRRTEARERQRTPALLSLVLNCRYARGRPQYFFNARESRLNIKNCRAPHAIGKIAPGKNKKRRNDEQEPHSCVAQRPGSPAALTTRSGGRDVGWNRWLGGTACRA